MTQPPGISIQMYSLRNVEGADAQFDLVQQVGYRHVELIGSHLDRAEETKAALDARGLAASSSHVGMPALRERKQAVIEACHTIAMTQLFMPAVPFDERFGDADYWTATGAELGALAVEFAAAGITLGYHNHHWELEDKGGGRTALDLLFAAAEGSPLAWQADVAWLVRGGADPIALLQKHSGRVASTHAKDLAPEGQRADEDGWADVGSGVLDWQALAAAAESAGSQWLVAEHDKPNDPERFTRASFAFLSALTKP